MISNMSLDRFGFNTHTHTLRVAHRVINEIIVERIKTIFSNFGNVGFSLIELILSQ